MDSIGLRLEIEVSSRRMMSKVAVAIYTLRPMSLS